MKLYCSIGGSGDLTRTLCYCCVFSSLTQNCRKHVTDPKSWLEIYFWTKLKPLLMSVLQRVLVLVWSEKNCFFLMQAFKSSKELESQNGFGCKVP